MKQTEKMAQTLYELLKEDNEGCYDTSIEVNEDQVSIEDQGGKIGIDFSAKTISVTGAFNDTFNANDKYELVDNYTTRHTKSIEFWTSQYGSQMACVTDQYDTYEELKDNMEMLSVFLYLDLDKVFKGVIK